MSTLYSLMIEGPDGWDTEYDVDQHIYVIMRSYDNGLTWHKLATMNDSDREDALEIINTLKLNSQKFNSFTEKKSISSKQYLDPIRKKIAEWDIHDD
jgi:hypothetical protein